MASSEEMATLPIKSVEERKSVLAELGYPPLRGVHGALCQSSIAG